MKIYHGRLRQIIREVLLREQESAEASSSVDPKIINNLKKLVSLSKKLYTDTRVKETSDADGARLRSERELEEGDVWIEELHRELKDRLHRAEEGELGKPEGRVGLSIGRTFGKKLKKVKKFFSEMGSFMSSVSGLVGESYLLSQPVLLEGFNPESAKKKLIRRLKNAIKSNGPDSDNITGRKIFMDKDEEKVEKAVAKWVGLLSDMLTDLGSAEDYEEILDILDEADTLMKWTNNPQFNSFQSSTGTGFHNMWDEATKGYRKDAQSAVAEAAKEELSQIETTRNILDDMLSLIRSPSLKGVYLTDLEELIQDIRLTMDDIAADGMAFLSRQDY